jgi:hypothetical protein
VAIGPGPFLIIHHPSLSSPSLVIANVLQIQQLPLSSSLHTTTATTMLAKSISSSSSLSPPVPATDSLNINYDSDDNMQLESDNDSRTPAKEPRLYPDNDADPEADADGEYEEDVPYPLQFPLRPLGEDDVKDSVRYSLFSLSLSHLIPNPGCR